MKKHLHKIAWVEPGSIAEELGLEPGDAIEEINGNEIEDIFDYQYYVEDEYLDVLILSLCITQNKLQLYLFVFLPH